MILGIIDFPSIKLVYSVCGVIFSEMLNGVSKDKIVLDYRGENRPLAII